MSPCVVEFHKDIAWELRDAEQWYAAQSASAAARFRAAFDQAVQEIGDGPERWPLGWDGTRKISLHKFPYVIYYDVTLTGAFVLAISHASRKPGYWWKRL